MIWCSLILALLALGLGQDVCGAGARSSGSGLIRCIRSYCHTLTQNDLVIVLTHAKPEALMSMSPSVRLCECPLMSEYVFVFLQCCSFETHSSKQFYDIASLFYESS